MNRSSLYRKTSPARQGCLAASHPALRNITLGLICLCLLASAFGQIVRRRRAADKGPRALGLLQIAANGHAQLFPITIMMNGKFYDAGAYKADPVPMALQPETVYEGVSTGVSQGLFTVGGAAQTHTGWFANGKWKTASEIKGEKEKEEAAKRAQKVTLPEDQIDAPPKLKRGSGNSSSSSPPSNPAPKTAPKESKPTTNSKAEGSSGASAAINPMEDPNRPILRRQAPSEVSHEQTKETPEPMSGPLKFIPAISDADGPDPRPYAYDMKPDEQQKFQTKMLAMATDAVRARVAQVVPSTASVKSAKAKAPPAPEFHDVKMRVFDLSNTNEPVLVLTAGAHSSAAPDLDFMVALVAREDIYGDLHKVLAETTDNKHLDVLPRYDLIDAVDADGDGRGELLFRESWDSGSAFGVYRVIGDQLWPLFEGKPGA
ncbi:MAG TPA: hypothetical protein VF133_09400 [Terriglobales bacterium]